MEKGEKTRYNLLIVHPYGEFSVKSIPYHKISISKINFSCKSVACKMYLNTL